MLGVSGKSRKYMLDDNVEPAAFPNSIRKIEASGRDDGFFLLEENSSSVKLFDKNVKQVGQVETRKMSVYEQRGAIYDFAYDSANDIIGFVTTDKKMYFYEGSDRMNLIHIAEKFKKNFTGLWHLPNRNLWVASSSDHFVMPISALSLIALKSPTLTCSQPAH